LTTKTKKNGRQNFWPEKSEFFSAGIENLCDQVHDPPDFEPDWRRWPNKKPKTTSGWFWAPVSQ